jgi:hypothetical protein
MSDEDILETSEEDDEDDEEEDEEIEPRVKVEQDEKQLGNWKDPIEN